MMLSTPTSSASAAPQTAAASQPVAAGAAPAESTATATANAGTAAAAGNAPAPQPFAQWLGQQADAQALQASLAAAAPVVDDADAAPAADDQATADDGNADAAGAATPDNTLLAAMAMPLMPLPAAQVAQALQAAQGGQAGARDADAGTDAPAVAAVGQDGARAAAQPLPAALAAAPAAAAATPAPSPSLQQAAPQTAQQDAGAALRVAVQADAGKAGSQAGSQDGSADHANSQAGTMPTAGVAVATATTAAQPAADTVKLAGPPTAWRQSLQEALGERLNVQVGKNVEQAVIRLEPPQLGRIDIAIRHSAGTLEVNISASNGEVLRQLQTVSDNLRSDLSQRQFTEVAVTVTPTPKNGAAPFGDPQQQGRGRQQGRDQDENAPGRALAEASTHASAFTLGGRDS